MDEYVMVIPTKALGEVGYFQGLSFRTKAFFHLIEDKTITTFLRRKDVENDENYKQIIPYVIFVHKDTAFSYRRGKLLKEKRLAGDFSIGIGGHISVFDENFFTETYKRGMAREINEEVRIESDYRQHLAAIINDDTNNVGRVHLGIVHIFELEKPQIYAKEKSISETTFIALSMLKGEIEKYENWSRICIQNIEELIKCQGMNKL